MAKKSVEVDGIKELLKQLERFGDQTTSIQKEVLHEAGKHLQREVKEEAVGLDDFIEDKRNDLYGKLHENIWLEWDESSKTTYITSGNAYWAGFVEYGTNGVPVGKRKKLNKQAPRSNKGMPAQPFMERTMRANQNKVKTIIENEVKKRLGL